MRVGARDELLQNPVSFKSALNSAAALLGPPITGRRRTPRTRCGSVYTSPRSECLLHVQLYIPYGAEGRRPRCLGDVLAALNVDIYGGLIELYCESWICTQICIAACAETIRCMADDDEQRFLFALWRLTEHTCSRYRWSSSGSTASCWKQAPFLRASV